MNDDDKALVERLEEWEWTLRAVYKAGDLGTDEPAIVMGEASNRIEALSAENERIKDRLGWICATMDLDDNVSLQWVYAELEVLRGLGDTK